MGTTIDENGFHRDRYQDVRDENAQRWNDSFPDMDTSTPRVAGRIISIQSAIHDNLNANVEYVNDTMDNKIEAALALLNAKVDQRPAELEARVAAIESDKK